MTPEEHFEFFGVMPGSVNVIITRIAMRDGGPPEWLRGRPTLVDLPRFEAGPLGHIVPVSRERAVSELPDHLVWVIENLQGPWSLTTEGWSFENATEALYFKMMT